MSGLHLREFIKESEKVVRSYPLEAEALRHLKPLLENLITTPNSVPPEAFTPRDDKFAMNLIYMPEDACFSIIGGVWKPGQATPIHDHLTWAMIGVYEGEERQAIYRRTDDKSNPKLARLEKVHESTNRKGHVTILGETGLHKVDNISGRPTVSIHLYGRDIGGTERHSYDPVTGEISAFLSGYCNVLRDPDRF